MKTNLIDYLNSLYYNLVGVSMKKNIIIIILIIIVSSIALVLYNKSNETRELLFSVTDVSKKCKTNTLYVYNDNTYEIKNNSLIINQKKEYNYDVNNIIENIKDYSKDEDTWMNYYVELKDGTTYHVSMLEENDLNNFIKSLNEEKLFECRS